MYTQRQALELIGIEPTKKNIGTLTRKRLGGAVYYTVVSGERRKCDPAPKLIEGLDWERKKVSKHKSVVFITNQGVEKLRALWS